MPDSAPQKLLSSACSGVSVNTDYLTACFARNICDSLLAAEQINQPVVDLIQGWEHSGFNVFVGEPIPGDDANARKFLVRYIKSQP